MKVDSRNHPFAPGLPPGRCGRSRRARVEWRVRGAVLRPWFFVGALRPTVGNTVGIMPPFQSVTLFTWASGLLCLPVLFFEGSLIWWTGLASAGADPASGGEVATGAREPGCEECGGEFATG